MYACTRNLKGRLIGLSSRRLLCLSLLLFVASCGVQPRIHPSDAPHQLPAAPVVPITEEPVWILLDASATASSSANPSTSTSTSANAGEVDASLDRPLRLQASVFKPIGSGRFPLAVVSHGSPLEPAQRTELSPANYANQARALAQLGFIVAVVMRRGYGESDGEWAESVGDCAAPNYLKAAEESASDVAAAVEFMRKRADVSATELLLVGESAGGFASLAAASLPKYANAQVLNFAGGRGYVPIATGEPARTLVCREDLLVAAFRALAARTVWHRESRGFDKPHTGASKSTQTWIYSSTDEIFPPSLARQLHAAYITAGVAVQLDTPEELGHNYFGHAQPQAWAARVKRPIQQ
jgi:dienelactone hydrolase